MRVGGRAWDRDNATIGPGSSVRSRFRRSTSIDIRPLFPTSFSPRMYLLLRLYPYSCHYAAFSCQHLFQRAPAARNFGRSLFFSRPSSQSRYPLSSSHLLPYLPSSCLVELLPDVHHILQLHGRTLGGCRTSSACPRTCSHSLSSTALYPHGHAMSEYEYEQYSADPMSSLEEGRTFPQQDSQAKRILLASSDSAHRRRSSSTIRSTAPSSSPSHELEKGELTDLRRNSATLSTLTLPNAVAATGPPPSANESSLITPASTSLVLPPPPEPVESVYEPPTPLPVRSSRRPLPALPDAPRFVPLHGLPPPPPPPSTVSRLKTGGSEELTTAEEEKRAYARASGMDDLFESRSASTSNDETGPPIPSSTATELPDYPAGGSTSLVRGQSILKRDQHDATIAENDEARANADEARQRINAESERLVELDAADSKAAARRRMEEAEEQNRQQGQQTSLDEHARARKRRDESVTLDFDIDEIDGLEDPPPPHDAVPALMPDDLLPLTDSKATWPVESEPATVSSRSVPIVPAASLLPPPPAPLAIASADPTSFPRPSLYQAQNERALASAPDFLPTTRPQVRRSTTVATLPVTHQESLFYPGAVAPLPASSHYVSPPSTSSVDTATRRGRVYRTTSVDPAAAFYTSEVGGAVSTVRVQEKRMARDNGGELTS